MSTYQALFQIAFLNESELLHNSDLKPMEHLTSFIGSTEANKYFFQLLALPWTQVKWSTNRTLPRLTYRYGDDGQKIDILDELSALIEQCFQVTIKGVWCNQYRNGNDWTPEHKDSYGGYVFTLSFGDSRSFYLKNDSTGQKTSFTLNHGDLYYFSPEIDRTHKHCVPKTAKSDSIRISVVFFT